MPIGIDAKCDASLLAHDNTFTEITSTTLALLSELSDSDTEEDSLSMSVLRHRSDLTLAILRPRRVEI